MALRHWQVIGRTDTMLCLATEGATILIESPRLTGGDASLDELIGRLAPHLAFGDLRADHDVTERTAVSRRDGQACTTFERIVVGRYTRGAVCVGYLLASRVPVDAIDLVSATLAGTSSPLAYLID